MCFAIFFNFEFKKNSLNSTTFPKPLPIQTDLRATQADVRRYSVKKVFLKFWQNHRCFPVNFAKFLRSPFFSRRPSVVTSGAKKKFAFQALKEYSEE